MPLGFFLILLLELNDKISFFMYKRQHMRLKYTPTLLLAKRKVDLRVMRGVIEALSAF